MIMTHGSRSQMAAGYMGLFGFCCRGNSGRKYCTDSLWTKLEVGGFLVEERNG